MTKTIKHYAASIAFDRYGNKFILCSCGETFDDERKTRISGDIVITEAKPLDPSIQIQKHIKDKNEIK